jgi:hypothetical protein
LLAKLRAKPEFIKKFPKMLGCGVASAKLALNRIIVSPEELPSIIEVYLEDPVYLFGVA